MITEAELLSLKPGDKVKIVNKWDDARRHNIEKMNIFLGKIVTVKKVEDPFGWGDFRIIIKEDLVGFVWNRNTVDYIVSRQTEAIPGTSNKAILGK